MTVFHICMCHRTLDIIHLCLDGAHAFSVVDFKRCKMTVLHSYMCHRTQDNHTFMFSQSTRYFILGFNPIQDDTFSQLHVTTNPGRLYMLHLKMNKCVHTNNVPFFLLYLRIFSQNEKSKHGHRTRYLEHYVCGGNELAAVMPRTV